jgi:hypothetical protein
MARVLVNLCTALGALVLVLGVLGGIWWLLWGERQSSHDTASQGQGEFTLALPRHPQSEFASALRLETVLRHLGAQVLENANASYISARFPDNADTVNGYPYSYPYGVTFTLTCTSLTTAQAQARCRTIERAYTGER